MANIPFRNVWHLLNKYEFNVDVQLYPDLICIICKKILNNPHQSPCGCRYCLNCIEEYLEHGDIYCPRRIDDCREQLINLERDLQIDHVANKLVSQIKVKCPLKSCQVIDEIKNMLSHIESHDARCPYFEMGCDGPPCGIDSMNNHLILDNYSHTRLLVDYIDNLKNEMAVMSDNFKIVVTELRDEIKELKLANNNKCQPLDSLNDSLTKNLVEKKIFNDYVANMKKEIKMIKENNKIKQGSFDEIKKDLKQLQLTNEITQNDIKSLFKDKELSGKNIFNSVDQETKYQPTLDENNLEERIPNYEFNPNVVHNPLFSPNKRFMNYSPYSWEIRNFKNYYNDAVKEVNVYILSDPFYSYGKGYKMRLCLYPNGIGTGKNDYLSIFFHIMKGENDNQLTWPMKHDVTITLIDNKTNQSYTGSTFKYNAAFLGNQSAFHRPITDMNIGCGSFQFVKSNIVFNNNRIFHNNSIVFNCFVNF